LALPTLMMHPLRRLAAVLLLLAGAVLAGILPAHLYRSLTDRIGSPVQRNVGTTYHVQMTVLALDGSAVKAHSLLPVVTLGRPQDRRIPWGATVPNHEGYYFYTSFLPPAFLVARAYIDGFGLTGRAQDYYGLNLILSAAAAALVFFLARALATPSPVATLLAFGLTVAFGLQPEIVHAYGIVYWACQLWLPVFLLQLLVLYRALKGEHVSVAVMAALALFSCLTEWAGYIANFAMAAALLAHARAGGAGKSDIPGAARLRRLAYAVSGAVVLAGITTLVWFSTQINLLDAVHGVVRSAGGRSILGGGGQRWWKPALLIAGYLASAGPLLLAACCVMRPLISAARSWIGSMRQRTTVEPALTIVAVAVATLSENVLLMQHAIEFTFARLKVIAILTLILAYFIPRRLSSGASQAAVVALVVLSAAWLAAFQPITYPVARPAYMESNERFAATLAKEPTSRSALYAGTGVHLGYLPALFHANLLSYSTLESLQTAMHERAIPTGVLIVQGNAQLGADAHALLGNSFIARYFASTLGYDVANILAVVEVDSRDCVTVRLRDSAVLDDPEMRRGLGERVWRDMSALGRESAGARVVCPLRGS
jgi:hypothetical protein